MKSDLRDLLELLRAKVDMTSNFGVDSPSDG